MRIVLLLLFATVALACNTTKRLASFSRTESTDTTTRVVTRDSSAVSERSELRTVAIDLASLEQVEVTVWEYDTARPIDTVTGTPPLQRAIVYSRRSEATQNGSTISKSTQHDAARLTTVDSSRAGLVDRTEVAQEVDRRMSPPWWVWLIKIALAVVAAWWIWRRIRR